MASFTGRVVKIVVDEKRATARFVCRSDDRLFCIFEESLLLYQHFESEGRRFVGARVSHDNERGTYGFFWEE